MKTNGLKPSKSQAIVMDKSLEKFRGKNFFPEQLAKINEILAKTGLPKVEKPR